MRGQCEGRFFWAFFPSNCWLKEYVEKTESMFFMSWFVLTVRFCMKRLFVWMDVEIFEGKIFEGSLCQDGGKPMTVATIICPVSQDSRERHPQATSGAYAQRHCRGVFLRDDGPVFFYLFDHYSCVYYGVLYYGDNNIRFHTTCGNSKVVSQSTRPCRLQRSSPRRPRLLSWVRGSS